MDPMPAPGVALMSVTPAIPLTPTLAWLEPSLVLASTSETSPTSSTLFRPK